MNDKIKTTLKIAGVYVLGFTTCLIVLQAFGLALSHWMNWNPATLGQHIFDFIMKIIIATIVWRIFFKWIREIKIIAFIKEHKRKNNIQV